jgi:hypothetical protein
VAENTTDTSTGADAVEETFMIKRNGQVVPGFGIGQVVVDGPSIVHTAVGIGVIVLLIGGVLYFVHR